MAFSLAECCGLKQCGASAARVERRFSAAFTPLLLFVILSAASARIFPIRASRIGQTRSRGICCSLAI
jgi:hypothetical protein